MTWHMWRSYETGILWIRQIWGHTASSFTSSYIFLHSLESLLFTLLHGLAVWKSWSSLYRVVLIRGFWTRWRCDHLTKSKFNISIMSPMVKYFWHQHPGLKLVISDFRKGWTWCIVLQWTITQTSWRTLLMTFKWKNSTKKIMYDIMIYSFISNC